MSDQDELHGVIRAFSEFDDSESLPLITSLSIWQAELVHRTAEHTAQAISLATRYERLIAESDAFFAAKLAHDQESAALQTERLDYSESFGRLQSQMLGAALRYRDKEAYYQTTAAVIEIVGE